MWCPAIAFLGGVAVGVCLYFAFKIWVRKQGDKPISSLKREVANRIGWTIIISLVAGWAVGIVMFKLC